MSDQRDDEGVELRRVNQQLKESLARCRFMLADARSKLAANSNEKDDWAAEERDAKDEGSHEG
ncbi:MAG: hypothetical protein ACM3ZV_12840 [Bacillota bacterium]